MIGPLERLGHGPVVIVDEGEDLGLQILNGGERAAFEYLAYQNREPDLHLIHPGAVFGRVHPGFKLPPLMWAEEEAVAVTLGLQIMYQLRLSQITATVESALARGSPRTNQPGTAAQGCASYLCYC